MKVILTAAGLGTRLRGFAKDLPKCTLKVGNKSLITYTVELFLKYNITDITIVIGYNGHLIQEELKDFKIKYYINPFYRVTNSLASLWFAQEELVEQDTIFMNADVFLSEDLLQLILDPHSNTIAFMDASITQHADYKFYVKGNKLVEYGKDMVHDKISGEYIGVIKSINKDISFYKNKLKEFICSEKYNMWWEDLFYQNINEKSLHIVDIKGHSWGEIDVINDYIKINNLVKS